MEENPTFYGFGEARVNSAGNDADNGSGNGYGDSDCYGNCSANGSGFGFGCYSVLDYGAEFADFQQ